MEGIEKAGAIAEENSPVDCFRRRGRDRRVSAGAIPIKKIHGIRKCECRVFGAEDGT